MPKWLRQLLNKWLGWLGRWGKDGLEPEPEEPTFKDDIDSTKVITHFVDRKVLTTFKLVTKITALWRDNLLRWKWQPDPKWKNVGGCNGNIWMFWKEGEQWHGGPCDKIRPGQFYKNAGDFKRTVAPWEPAKNGEEVAIMFSTHCRHNVRQNGEERSAIKKFGWPPNER